MEWLLTNVWAFSTAQPKGFSAVPGAFQLLQALVDPFGIAGCGQRKCRGTPVELRNAGVPHYPWPLVDNPISLPPDTLHCTLSPHSFWCCKIFWVTCPRLSRFPLFKRGFRSPMFVDQNHVSAGPISISCCCRSPGCRNHPPSRWDSTSTWFKQKTMWFNQWNWAVHGSRGADPPLTAPCIPYVD